MEKPIIHIVTIVCIFIFLRGTFQCIAKILKQNSIILASNTSVYLLDNTKVICKGFFCRTVFPIVNL